MTSGFTLDESLQKASVIINNLEASKFPLLLTRIAQSLQSKSRGDEKPFSDDEQEKLQAALGLNKEDLILLLDSLTNIFKQAAYHMIKPTVLQKQLIDTLKLNDDKAEVFTNIWATSAKGIVEQLRQISVFPTQLENIKWSLNVQTASESQAKQTSIKAIFQLGLTSNDNEENSKENLTLEFNHQELFEFYKQLETIQSQLDALR